MCWNEAPEYQYLKGTSGSLSLRYEADRSVAGVRSESGSPIPSFAGLSAAGGRRNTTIHASLDFSDGHLSQNLQVSQ
jgi:hypothetical protein